jgi:hypothetical protein
MPAAEPSEIVIWSASSLLSVVLGIGGAFFLWSSLQDLDRVELVPLLVAGFGTGVLLLGLASKRPLVRAAIALFAVTLVLSFIVGSHSFARLV